MSKVEKTSDRCTATDTGATPTEPAAGKYAAVALAERLALFVDMALEALWDGHDLDGADIQDEAQRLGLIVTVPFDPEKHNDDQGVGVEDGDPWNVPAADYQRLANKARRAVQGA